MRFRFAGLCAASAVLAMLGGCVGSVQESGARTRGPESRNQDPEAVPGEPQDESSTACESAPDVGSVVIHRLNQFEYRNTIRSVTGVVLAEDPTFPTEESAEFPNSAILLKTTAAQLEWYLNTAISVVDTLMKTQGLRARFYDCDLAQAPCWQAAMKRFSEKAYRRPASTEELGRLGALHDVQVQAGATPEVALRTAFEAALVAPQFLYRNVALTAPGDASKKQKLDGYELATRLSYFIWGDAPDSTLIQNAVSGQLEDPTALATELTRMLQDPRAADNLGQNFYFHWLGLGELENRSPDTRMFPEFNERLRSDMIMESQLFFRDLVAENRPLADLLTADFTYINANLSSFYGIPGGTDSTFKKVSLSGTERIGALTHGSLMTVTSHSSGTSVIRRGAFIALNLQCIEIPPPPMNVGALAPPDGKNSIRERLEAHRSNPVCASCHRVMDPPGFGLENFNAIGKVRTVDDEGFPLDTAGVLYNGARFRNARELAAGLTADEAFHRCGVQKLATFALGRRLAKYDQCTIEKIVNASSGKTLKEVLVEIIASDFFRYERGGEAI